MVLKGMVFCYQNCSDLLTESIVLVIEKNLLKFEAEGQEFAKILRSLEQFFLTVGQNNFGNKIPFLWVPYFYDEIKIFNPLVFFHTVNGGGSVETRIDLYSTLSKGISSKEKIAPTHPSRLN